MKPEVQFRSATESDYQSICDLVTTKEELFLIYPDGTYPFSFEQLNTLAAVRKELTVALSGEAIVGFSNLYDYECQHSAFIGNVVVDKTMRGQGLGRKLIAFMLDLGFGKHQLQEVNISVFSHNIPALLLYAKFGFTPCQFEERENTQGQRMIMIHMTLPKSKYEERKQVSLVGK